MGNKNIALHDITFFTYCSCSGSRIAYTRRMSVTVVYRNGRTRSITMRVTHCLRPAESKGLVHGGSVAPPHILLPQRLSQQRCRFMKAEGGVQVQQVSNASRMTLLVSGCVWKE